MRKAGLHLDPVKSCWLMRRRSLKLGEFKGFSSSSDEITQAGEKSFLVSSSLNGNFFISHINQ